MSQTHAEDRREEGTPHFCGECGSPLSGGRFCRSCGHAIDGAAAAGEPTQAFAFAADAPRETWDAPADHRVPPAPPLGAPASRPAGGPRNRRTLVAVAVVALLAVAGALAFVLLGSGSGDDADAAGLAYRKQVAATMGPVLGGNEQVSSELARLRGTKPTDARAAVARARETTTRATGALGALAVPAGSEALSRDTRQVLDREAAYLSGVAAVLGNPSNPSRSQLQTLSSNLASALSAAGPAVSGATQTVSGADRAEAWALRASRTLRNRAADRRARARRAAARRTAANRQGSGSSTSTSRSTTSPVSNPYSNGRACGGSVFAGPNTSCEFARNVRQAWLEAPGTTNTVQVFSPVTGTTYTMSCSPSGAGISCSGANNASVTF